MKGGWALVALLAVGCEGNTVTGPSSRPPTFVPPTLTRTATQYIPPTRTPTPQLANLWGEITDSTGRYPVSAYVTINGREINPNQPATVYEVFGLPPGLANVSAIDIHRTYFPYYTTIDLKPGRNTLDIKMYYKGP